VKRYEVRLSGAGGQGIILSGIILADAAMRDGLHTVQTQSYGPEARGGASRAEVVVSEQEIDYPKVTRPDLVLVMSEEAYERYGRDVDEGTVVILDEGVGPAEAGGNVHVLPLTELAKRETGRAIGANIVALGAMAAVTGVVSMDSLRAAVAARVPRGTEEPNLRALEAGYREAEKAVSH